MEQENRNPRRSFLKWMLLSTGSLFFIKGFGLGKIEEFPKQQINSLSKSEIEDNLKKIHTEENVKIKPMLPPVKNDKI